MPFWILRTWSCVADSFTFHRWTLPLWSAKCHYFYLVLPVVIISSFERNLLRLWPWNLWCCRSVVQVKYGIGQSWKIPNFPCHQACHHVFGSWYRGMAFSCFKMEFLLEFWFGAVYIKTCKLNCLIFASIVYYITVCSCSAVKTCVRCVTCYIFRRQVTWP